MKATSEKAKAKAKPRKAASAKPRAPRAVQSLAKLWREYSDTICACKACQTSAREGFYAGAAAVHMAIATSKSDREVQAIIDTHCDEIEMFVAVTERAEMGGAGADLN